jgi:hypothetical protein
MLNWKHYSDQFRNPSFDICIPFFPPSIHSSIPAFPASFPSFIVPSIELLSRAVGNCHLLPRSLQRHNSAPRKSSQRSRLAFFFLGPLANEVAPAPSPKKRHVCKHKIRPHGVPAVAIRNPSIVGMAWPAANRCPVLGGIWMRGGYSAGIEALGCAPGPVFPVYSLEQHTKGGT